MKNNYPYQTMLAINARSDQHVKFSTVSFLPAKLFIAALILWLLVYGCVPPSYYNQIALSQGKGQEARGKYDSAVLSYSALIKKDPHNADAYQSRALAYSNLNKMTEALADMDQAISIDHRKWDLYYSRAGLLEKQQMYNQAANDYSTYIKGADKKSATYYLGYWGRGKVNMFSNKTNEAIEDFSQAIKLKPTDYNLYDWRAGCYFEQKKYLDASRDYEIFLNQNPRNYKQQFQLGVCYSSLSQKDKALVIYTKLAEYDPSIKIIFTGDHQLDFYNIDWRRKLTLQFLNDATGDMQGIESITSKSLLDITLNSAFEKLMTSWGYALNLNTADRVILDTLVSKIYYIYPKLKVKPTVPEYVRRFTVQANSFVEEKKYNDAIEKYQLSLGITPYYPFAHFNLAMLYSTVGQYKKAIEQMNVYLKLAPDATDARAAQDKIYEWEIKVKD